MKGTYADQSQNAIYLADLLMADRPSDDKSWRLRPFRSNQLPSDTHYGELAASLAAKTAKRTDATQAREKALHLILRNLTVCLFEHHWLTLPVSGKNFEGSAQGKYLRGLGLTRRIMEDSIKVLINEGWMQLGRAGYKFRPEHGNGESKASNFRATEKLARLFAAMLYEDRGGWDADHYQIHPQCSQQERKYHNERGELLDKYNEFISGHSYALKGPMGRSFSDYPDRGGRITNNYQNIVQRRLPIRKQTLIDGENLVEPDFSANHLRMAAYLMGESLPDDPYAHLTDQTGISDRGMVKKVATECMGATDWRQLGPLKGRFHKRYRGGSIDKFQAILTALRTEYPWTSEVFFCDVGAHLQYLEGEMALKMMSWAMAHNVPLIPVHDAYAVPARYSSITYESMSIVWEVVMNEALQRNDLLKKARERAPAMYEASKRK